MNLVAKFCDCFSVSLFLVTRLCRSCYNWWKEDISVCQLWTKTKCFSYVRNRYGFPEVSFLMIQRNCCWRASWQKQQWSFSPLNLVTEYLSGWQSFIETTKTLVNFFFIRAETAKLSFCTESLQCNWLECVSEWLVAFGFSFDVSRTIFANVWWMEQKLKKVNSWYAIKKCRPSGQSAIFETYI